MIGNIGSEKPVRGSAAAEELMEIASEWDRDEYDRIVSERKSWPVLYHFSSIRRNILAWYSDFAEKRVLEIGSGCGALTEFLAERAASVTCVEESEEACRINSARCRGYDNVEILSGRFEDVEGALGRGYDVITLIDLFRYAGRHVTAADPYEELLRRVRDHLSPDGVVLLADFNRLGMQYFAGCAQDDAGRYFTGIEGYPEDGDARTFDRPSLTDLSKRAGFPDPVFYYPYPDHRFPMAVYSDAYLPRPGDLRQNITNFDSRRLILFDEAKAYDALGGSGLIPLFMNSYLVELRKEPSGDDGARTVFAKFSNERADDLSIRTDIVSDGTGGPGHLFVRKAPAGRRAAAHVRGMETIFRRLGESCKGSRFTPNRLRMEGENAVFEYLEGETLEAVFDRTYLHDAGKTAEAFRTYFAELDRLGDGPFVMTNEFRRVFGDVHLPEGLPGTTAADIDMVLNNIIVTDDRNWHIIDYEWTFLFSVPVGFIKWRALHYYIEGNTKRFFLRDADLLSGCGFTEAELAAYENMERAFQSYIEGGRVPIRELYADISEGAADLNAILKRMSGQRDGEDTARLYPDTGSGFSEETAVTYRPEGGRIRIACPVSGVRAVRIDPAEYAGYMTILSLSTELGPLDPSQAETNGVHLDLRRILFDTNDPYLLVSGWPSEAKYLYAELTMVPMDVDSAEFMRTELDRRDRRILELLKADRKKEDLMAFRQEAAKQLMKTKVLKAYRKLRVKTGKTDPYAVLRPLLPSDPNGILYCIDHTSHRKEGFFLRGWCFDREYAGERVFVVNSKDNEVPSEITRYRRSDVAASFDLPEEREMGFSVLIPYDMIKEPPVYLEVENARGYTCEKLAVELDPAKRDAANAAIRAAEGAKHVITGYDDFAHEHEVTEAELASQRAESRDLLAAIRGGDGNGRSGVPLFSVVVPLYRTDPVFLRELIDSVLGQSFPYFELVLSDGSGADSPLDAILSGFEKQDARVKVVRNPSALRISENTNAAVRASCGEWIVFADHDDVLTKDALFENARVIHEKRDVRLIYSDEDKLFEGGLLDQPNFKPDFSPDFLTSVNYICHLVAVSRTLFEEAGPLDPAFDGAQDHDFLLRCSEIAGRAQIAHIPKVLYHWRAGETSTAADPAAKEYAFSAGVRAVSAHFERIGIPAVVTRGQAAGLYRVRYRVNGEPLISVVIPNKDHIGDLVRCIESIESKTDWPNREYVIVENNSTEAETFEGYKKLQSSFANVRIVRYEGAFNYSAINNFGVREARGDYLLFLNNDTEMKSSDALTVMLGVCQRADVGAVGARLYFGDGSIQHAGVVLGYGDIAGHAFREFGGEETGYQNRIILQQDVSAVTAACMMVRRSVFEEVGGFFEGLAVAFNDIDLCMKMTAADYLIVYEPNAEFFHYESKSRGYEDTPEKQARFENEVRIFKERWPEAVRRGDPYYNPNLTLKRPDFTLKTSDEYNE